MCVYLLVVGAAAAPAAEGTAGAGAAAGAAPPGAPGLNLAMNGLAWAMAGRKPAAPAGMEAAMERTQHSVKETEGRGNDPIEKKAN